MWLSKKKKKTDTFWPQSESQVFFVVMLQSKIILQRSWNSSFSFLEALHTALLVDWTLISGFQNISNLAKLESPWDSWGQNLSWIPSCYWQCSASRTGSHTEASLLTSDTLRFNCFVFQFSNSTLYNINTADMVYKLISPYLTQRIHSFNSCTVRPFKTNLQWTAAAMVTA